jgi:uncharacterized protein
MFKAPSRSKRRLATEIGPHAAAAAAERLFACAREDAAAWSGPVCYAPAEPADIAWLDREFGPQPIVVVQRGANLGARINYVDDTLRQRGFGSRIYIGIDCPELDSEYLEAAAAQLERCDLVIGPARDGGAVVIGTRRPLPDLAHLPWSTEGLKHSLIELVEAQSWTVDERRELTDIDTLDDLHAAAAALRNDTRAARRALCAWVAAAAATSKAAP